MLRVGGEYRCHVLPSLPGSCYKQFYVRLAVVIYDPNALERTDWTRGSSDL